jgi:hypothetical protein
MERGSHAHKKADIISALGERGISANNARGGCPSPRIADTADLSLCLP